MLYDLAAVALAYGLGCVQPGYYAVRVMTGRDLRQLGSGSTGATNAGRVLGRRGFIFTLLMDTGKGALAVVAARALGASDIAVAAAMVAAAAGHVWPVQLGFSGGRGVAVALGSLAVFDLRLLGWLAAVTLMTALLSRRFQTGGLAGFALLPAAAWFMPLPPEAVAGTAGLSLIVLFAHRTHIAHCFRHTVAADEGGYGK